MYSAEFLSAIINVIPSFGLLQVFLQLGAATLCPDDPVPSLDGLADQIIEILNYFR